MTTTLRSRDDLADLLRGPTSLQLTGLLTLLIVALNASHDSHVAVFLMGVTALIIGFLRPAVLELPAWWFAVTLVMGGRILMEWEGVDNHVILTTYWCLAIGCCLLAARPLELVALSGRLLIGLAFAFATFWKVAVAEFRGSEFFEFTLLLDDRFRAITTTVGGLSNADYAENLGTVAAIGTADSVPMTVDLHSTAAIAMLAVILTIGTIVVELAVAGVFLAPLPDRWTFLRPVTILVFCFFTYVIVPVGGFGLLLLTMALADRQLAPKWHKALLVAMACLFVYIPVWPLLTR